MANILLIETALLLFLLVFWGRSLLNVNFNLYTKLTGYFLNAVFVKFFFLFKIYFFTFYLFLNEKTNFNLSFFFVYFLIYFISWSPYFLFSVIFYLIRFVINNNISSFDFFFNTIIFDFYVSFFINFIFLNKYCYYLPSDIIDFF